MGRKNRKNAAAASASAPPQAAPRTGKNFNLPNDPAVTPISPGGPARRFNRLLIVLAGIVVCQFILFGPSLIGKKILLPLDILAKPRYYIPQTPGAVPAVPSDIIQSDWVLNGEPERRFFVSELHAGRLPMWTPYQYAGSPEVSFPKFSPLTLLECTVTSPLILPWAQLFAAAVAGLGAYLFCRRVLAVGFWPAAIVAWCYPMTGFFVFWEGSRPSGAVHWLPWLLVAVDRTIRRTNRFAPVEVSVVTGLVLVSGGLDVCGQVLLTSGLFAVWRWLETHWRQRWQPPARRALLAVATAWALGFLLAMPYILPLLEYAKTGARMQRRGAGEEERPPTGISALPQVVLPDIYGRTQVGSLRPIKGNQIESSAATYAGLLATLLVAPLAFCSRRHRSLNVFWILLGILGLAWNLNVPGLVTFLRLPGMNMMSHNRFVFATSFAILAMAAVGLEVIRRGELRRRWWFWFPIVLVCGLCAWSIYRAKILPEPIKTQLGTSIKQGKDYLWVHSLADVERVKAWHARSATFSAILCGVGVIAWLVLWFRPPRPAKFISVLAVLLTSDLLRFAYGRSVQSDPALYYPRIPALEEIAKATPGRIVGNNCLPAALAQLCSLRDIRGYDAIDPARLMKLMTLAADSQYNPTNTIYALTQWYSPSAHFNPPNGVRFSPILDMLNVRYMVFRGTPPSGIHPVFQSPDYYVLVNSNALPRAFVPSRVESVPFDRERLISLGSAKFNAREVAYVETPISLPTNCVGSAEITSEIPTRITIAANMQTPGLVVLADLWDKGWHAYLDGKLTPILRANHAIRGVVVPSGKSTLEFRYEPESFTRGLCLASLAVVILLAWPAIVVWQQRRKAATRDANGEAQRGRGETKFAN